MVAKESVRSRLSRADTGISYTEFSYMLLQAYDFLQLYDDFGCTLQFGGSDQWGNITMGIELIRKVRQAEAFGLTSPLVLKADGTKFGKTESGTVWLDADRTSPYQLHQFFLRSEDAMVGTYLRYFTFLDHGSSWPWMRPRPSTPSAGRPTMPWPARCAPGARRRGDGAGRAGGGRTVRRGARRAGRADTARRVRRRTVDGLPRSRLEGEMRSLWTSCRNGPAGIEEPGPDRRRPGRGLREQRTEDDVTRRLSTADLIADRYVVLRRGKKDHHLLRFG